MLENRHSLPNQTLGTAREIVSYHYGSRANACKVYIQSSLHADELPGMLVSYLLRQRLAELEAAGALPAEIVDPLRGTAKTLTCAHGGRLFARQLQRFATAGETIAKVAGRTAFRTGDLLSA